MNEYISIQGKFGIYLFDEQGILTDSREINNKITKNGLILLANGVGLNILNTIRVGEDNSPTSFVQNNLFSPLGDGDFFSNFPGLTIYQKGYLNYYPPGRAVGTWREIAAVISSSSHIFNRALIDPPLFKDSGSTALASVIITIKRTHDNGP